MNKELKENFEQTINELLDDLSASKGADQNQTALVLSRVVEDYTKMKQTDLEELKELNREVDAIEDRSVKRSEINANLEQTRVEELKSKREARTGWVAPTITAVSGLAATGAWIIFEKTEIVSGQSGKEILRNVVSTIFKKK